MPDRGRNSAQYVNSNAEEPPQVIKRQGIWCVGLMMALLASTPAAAQSQSGQDCALPGGCGSSSKPGGTEHRPDPADTPGRGRAKSIAPALGSATPSLKDMIKGPSSRGDGSTAKQAPKSSP